MTGGGHGQVPPEWLGYLAAFDAYLDARKRDDDETAGQARTLMGRFAGELLDDGAGTSGRQHFQLDQRSVAAALRFLER
jgi:hypothetical protein